MNKEKYEVYELVLKHYIYDQDSLEKRFLEEPICVRQMIDHSIFNFNDKSFVINDMFNRLKEFLLKELEND